MLTGKVSTSITKLFLDGNYPETHVANWFGGTLNSSKFIFLRSPIRPRRCDTVRVNLDGIEGGQHQQDNLGTKGTTTLTSCGHPVLPFCPNVPTSPFAISRDLSFTPETSGWNGLKWMKSRKKADFCNTSDVFTTATKKLQWCRRREWSVPPQSTKLWTRTINRGHILTASKQMVKRCKEKNPHLGNVLQ